VLHGRAVGGGCTAVRAAVLSVFSTWAILCPQITQHISTPTNMTYLTKLVHTSLRSILNHTPHTRACIHTYTYTHTSAHTHIHFLTHKHAHTPRGDPCDALCTGQRVLLVVHGGVIAAAYRKATGGHHAPRAHNGSVHALAISHKKWAVVRWGDTSAIGAGTCKFGGGEGGV